MLLLLSVVHLDIKKLSENRESTCLNTVLTALSVTTPLSKHCPCTTCMQHQHAKFAAGTGVYCHTRIITSVVLHLRSIGPSVAAKLGLCTFDSQLGCFLGPLLVQSSFAILTSTSFVPGQPCFSSCPSLVAG